jgi:deoxyribodipyrimidine photolyase-related protein
MNIKMISQEVIASAIQEWEKRPNEIEYNQLEGFVRQMDIGWREYMRGIYWLKMPDCYYEIFQTNQESYQNGFGPKPNALFKRYHKSVLN